MKNTSSSLQASFHVPFAVDLLDLKIWLEVACLEEARDMMLIVKLLNFYNWLQIFDEGTQATNVQLGVPSPCHQWDHTAQERPPVLHYMGDDHQSLWGRNNHYWRDGLNYDIVLFFSCSLTSGRQFAILIVCSSPIPHETFRLWLPSIPSIISAACRVFKHSCAWLKHTHVVSLTSQESDA